MSNTRRLYIEKHYDEVEREVRYVDFLHLNSFYDIKTHVGVKEVFIKEELKEGYVYDFTYESCDDSDTYSYLVLKKGKHHVYYLSEYYGKLYRHDEKLLGDTWVHCDVSQVLGIDLEMWESASIKEHDVTNLERTISTYIADLDKEIENLQQSILNSTIRLEASTIMNSYTQGVHYIESRTRLDTLREVRNDLQCKLTNL